MDGQINLVTLLSIVVAVVVIFKLRSVLGRRTPDDETRIDKRMRAEQAQERAAAAQDKVVALPRRPREAAPVPAAAEVATADAEARIKGFAGGDASVENGLMQMAQADGSFDPKQFIDGAKQAYEMIVTAFAEGNRKVLKDLLSKEVFDGFAAAIGDRENRAEVIDQSFVGIGKADIVEAELKNGTASITMKFLSQLISATRDKTGAVIAGDAQKIKEVTDIWTFARDVTSRNPNWRLVATQSPN